jgi:hypothetical protein
MSIKYSKGICWLDDCRIPTTELLGREQKSSHNYAMLQGGYNDGFWDNTKGLGRFTPNLLVCDDMLNDGIKPNKGHRAKGKVSGYGEFGGGKSEYHGVGEYMEVDSKSRYYDLDLWFDKLIKELN